MAVREATKDNFRELIQKDVVVAEFFSDNCLPCQLMAKVLEDVSLDMPFISILKVNSSKYAALGIISEYVETELSPPRENRTKKKEKHEHER